jgi:hypothetical protein
LGQDVEGNANPEKPLEVSCLANAPTNKEEEETGNDVESVGDISGFCDGKIVDNLQKGREIVVPAVVRELIRQVQKTGTNQRSVSQEVELQERNWREVELIQGEHDEENESNNDHRDDVSCSPSVGGHGRDVERQEEDDQTGGKQEDAKSCAE